MELKLNNLLNYNPWLTNGQGSTILYTKTQYTNKNVMTIKIRLSKGYSMDMLLRTVV
jgi:hypothetical protein